MKRLDLHGAAITTQRLTGHAGIVQQQAQVVPVIGIIRDGFQGRLIRTHRLLPIAFRRQHGTQLRQATGVSGCGLQCLAYRLFRRLQVAPRLQNHAQVGARLRVAWRSTQRLFKLRLRLIETPLPEARVPKTV